MNINYLCCNFRKVKADVLINTMNHLKQKSKIDHEIIRLTSSNRFHDIAFEKMDKDPVMQDGSVITIFINPKSINTNFDRIMFILDEGSFSLSEIVCNAIRNCHFQQAKTVVIPILRLEKVYDFEYSFSDSAKETIKGIEMAKKWIAENSIPCNKGFPREVSILFSKENKKEMRFLLEKELVS